MTTVDVAASATVRMREIVDAHTASGPYTPAVAAAEIVDKLRATDPDLLDEWMHAQAIHFVWQMINDRDRSQRAFAAKHARASAFQAAAESHMAGDSSQLRREFLDSPWTVEDGSRRRLGELRKSDLLFLASSYDDRARRNAMWAAFARALAKKVGGNSVEEAFTEDQIADMWRSLAAA